jgi:16S rRNA C1402 N4-methylase RsmH
VVNWGHELLAEKLCKGQLTVDLTAGNGHDTLMLYRLVGSSGQVVAFDIQSQALQNTRQRLLDHRAVVRMQPAGQVPLPLLPGVDLVEAGHEALKDFMPAAPQGIIANLGYLPGGDPQLVTRPESTLRALQHSCELLAPGGRLVVVVYPGHPGGREEGGQVAEFFADLCAVNFQTLHLKVANCPQSPFLLVAEKMS